MSCSDTDDHETDSCDPQRFFLSGPLATTPLPLSSCNRQSWLSKADTEQCIDESVGDSHESADSESDLIHDVETVHCIRLLEGSGADELSGKEDGSHRSGQQSTEDREAVSHSVSGGNDDSSAVLDDVLISIVPEESADWCDAEDDDIIELYDVDEDEDRYEDRCHDSGELNDRAQDEVPNGVEGKIPREVEGEVLVVPKLEVLREVEVGIRSDDEVLSEADDKVLNEAEDGPLNESECKDQLELSNGYDASQIEYKVCEELGREDRCPDKFEIEGEDDIAVVDNEIRDNERNMTVAIGKIGDVEPPLKHSQNRELKNIFNNAEEVEDEREPPCDNQDLDESLGTKYCAMPEDGDFEASRSQEMAEPELRDIDENEKMSHTDGIKTLCSGGVEVKDIRNDSSSIEGNYFIAEIDNTAAVADDEDHESPTQKENHGSCVHEGHAKDLEIQSEEQDCNIYQAQQSEECVISRSQSSEENDKADQGRSSRIAEGNMGRSDKHDNSPCLITEEEPSCDESYRDSSSKCSLSLGDVGKRGDFSCKANEMSKSAVTMKSNLDPVSSDLSPQTSQPILSGHGSVDSNDTAASDLCCDPRQNCHNCPTQCECRHLVDSDTASRTSSPHFDCVDMENTAIPRNANQTEDDDDDCEDFTGFDEIDFLEAHIRSLSRLLACPIELLDGPLPGHPFVHSNMRSKLHSVEYSLRRPPVPVIRNPGRESSATSVSSAYSSEVSRRRSKLVRAPKASGLTGTSVSSGSTRFVLQAGTVRAVIPCGSADTTVPDRPPRALLHRGSFGAVAPDSCTGTGGSRTAVISTGAPRVAARIPPGGVVPDGIPRAASDAIPTSSGRSVLSGPPPALIPGGSSAVITSMATPPVAAPASTVPVMSVGTPAATPGTRSPSVRPSVQVEQPLNGDKASFLAALGLVCRSQLPSPASELTLGQRLRKRKVAAASSVTSPVTVAETSPLNGSRPIKRSRSSRLSMIRSRRRSEQRPSSKLFTTLPPDAAAVPSRPAVLLLPQTPTFIQSPPSLLSTQKPNNCLQIDPTSPYIIQSQNICSIAAPSRSRFCSSHLVHQPQQTSTRFVAPVARELPLTCPTLAGNQLQLLVPSMVSPQTRLLLPPRQGLAGTAPIISGTVLSVDSRTGGSDPIRSANRHLVASVDASMEGGRRIVGLMDPLVSGWPTVGAPHCGDRLNHSKISTTNNQSITGTVTALLPVKLVSAADNSATAPYTFLTAGKLPSGSDTVTPDARTPPEMPMLLRYGRNGARAKTGRRSEFNHRRKRSQQTFAVTPQSQGPITTSKPLSHCSQLVIKGNPSDPLMQTVVMPIVPRLT